MAIEIAGKDTLLAVNATQITAEFPAGVVSSDLLLACVTHMWGGGSHISTPTNWTLIGNQAFTAFGTQSWFWRIAGTSEPEPTFTNTSPGAREWHVSIRQIRGHHATTPIVGYNTSGGATPAQVTPSAGAFAAPVVNSGYTNNLVYYSCYQYQAAPPYAPVESAISVSAADLRNNTQYVSIARRFVTASGNTPAWNWRTHNTQAAMSWCIVIRDAASGNNNDLYVNGGAETLRSYQGTADAATYVTPYSQLGAATVDGAAFSNTAITPSSYSSFTSKGWSRIPLSVVTTENTAGADKWVGVLDTYADDLSGKTVCAYWGSPDVAGEALGASGVIWMFVDGTGNWSCYKMLTRGEIVLGKQYGFVVNADQTPYASSATPCDWADIAYHGILLCRNYTGSYTTTMLWQQFVVLNDWIICGGCAAKPVGPKNIEDIYNGNALPALRGLFQGSGQLVAKAGVQFGDGTNTTYTKLTASNIQTPLSTDQTWQVPIQAEFITLNPSSGDTVDISASTVSPNTRQHFRLHASANTGATYITSGASILGADVAWKTGIDCDGVSFSGNYDVDLKGADCAAINVSNPQSTAALQITESGSTLTNSTTDVSGTAAAYHLELGTAVKQLTLASHTFTGTAATDKVHALKTSATVAAGAFVTGDHYEIKTVGTTDFTAIGASANTIGVRFTATGAGTGTGDAYAAVKITISGTTSLTEADVTSAGAVIWVAAPQPTLDSVVLANTRALLWNRTTSAELDNVWVTGTTWSKTITSGASSGDILDLYTFKEGYLESRATISYSGADATFAVDQATDPAIQYYRTSESVTDYTTLTEFNFYAPDIYIQSDDADGATSLKRLFIFYNGSLTTEDGARYMRGGITFNSAFDVIINRSVTPIAVDNVSATLGLYFTDEATIRVTTDDGTSWIAPPSAPGSIRYAFGVAPGQVETGVSGLTGAESTQLMALPSATAIVATAVDGTTTLAESLRLANAVLGGKVSGAGTGTETFRDLADTKNRVVATVDSSGNRTALTRDLT